MPDELGNPHGSWAERIAGASVSVPRSSADIGAIKPDPVGRAAGKDAYAHKLYLSDFLREPTIRAAIGALQFSPGSRGLDAGCGIGSHTMLLAEAVAPGGHVIGLDLSSDLLARARETAMGHSLSGHVSFREGDLHRLPFEDEPFDWVWSVDCAGYPARGSVSLIRELARVVRPAASSRFLAGPLRDCFRGILC